MPLEDKNNLSKTVLVAKRSITIVNNIVFPKPNAALDEVQRQNLGKEKNINLNFKDKKHKYVDVSIIHSTTQTPNNTLTGVSNSGTTRIPLNLAYSKIIAMSSLV